MPSKCLTAPFPLGIIFSCGFVVLTKYAILRESSETEIHVKFSNTCPTCNQRVFNIYIGSKLQTEFDAIIPRFKLIMDVKCCEMLGRNSL